MAEKWTIKYEHQLTSFCDHARAEMRDGRAVHLQFIKPHRTEGQNALLHQIIRDVARQQGQESVGEVKRFVKLFFGVPELRASDESFRARYDSVIKDVLSYEQKLEAMDLLPVTSTMNTEQLGRVIDAAIAYYSQKGVDLSHLGKFA